MLRNREELIRRLRSGPVSRAVRWYDPSVLVRAGVRDVLAAVFGEYADQRLMQAATDRVGIEGLKERYDYSRLNETDWDKSIPVDETKAFWIDYIADVGDGFGPTYGMAAMLAPEKLDVGGLALPAGKILILGGDQCYPQATREEYEERFVLPYAAALPPTDEKHERKLFALPGNHDWYDGLSAFDSLFCQSRAQQLGAQHASRIGGWRCVQHRSYWAIHLPYDWWLWGVDIQFSKHLDAPQENYFRTMASKATAGHNIVLCIAEPHWLDAEFDGVEAVDSLHTIVRIAQSNGAEVRAVLAGDWHHYSHYRLDELYHPDAVMGRDKPIHADRGIHLVTAGGGGAFLHSTTDLRRKVDVSWGAPASPSGDPNARAPRRYKGIAEMVSCYPSRRTSALLSLKNLALPIRNWRFALVLGALYWIMTWQYHVVAKTTPELAWLKKLIADVDYATINSLSNQMLLALFQVAAENILYCVMLAALWAGLVWYVTVSAKRTPLLKGLARVSVGTLHALVHLKAMFLVFATCMAFNADAGISGIFYPLEAFVLGGLVGGAIFGAYWVLAGLLARMHTGDAFGALGIRDYKNFLRMKFERDKLTIYPIGVKKLPGTRSFRVGRRYKAPADGQSLLALSPKLKPVVIGNRDSFWRKKQPGKPIEILRRVAGVAD